jgi:sugar/nucleoside kinase (ribokinase family)
LPIDCLSAGILVADHLCAPIDHLPKAGELVLSDALPLTIGGCASNTAMNLARVGLGVGVIGCVGRDPFGRFVVETLAAQGIDTSGIQELADVPTSGTLIVNVRGEDRRFIHTVGANGAFRASDVPPALVERARAFYVGGYLLMSALDPEELAALFARARRHGVKTFLDVVLPGPQDHWGRLAPVLRQTDVFHCNRDEAEAITGQSDPVRQAERFRSAGAGTVVITLGHEGTILLAEGLRLRAAAYPMPFVGGTGAGDAFDAGFIAGLLAGEDPRGCLRWGSALGASCVRAIGATESVFTRAEAEAFIQSHPLEIAEL